MHRAACSKKIFIRVYGLTGQKSAKGFLAGTTDSSVIVLKDSIHKEILASNIGYIKTKRTAGHNILISSVIGAAAFGILGAATGEQKVNDDTFGGSLHDALTYTPAEGFAAGFLFGAGLGAGTGAIIYAVGKHHIFNINGNLENFQHQRQAIDGLLQ